MTITPVPTVPGRDGQPLCTGDPVHHPGRPREGTVTATFVDERGIPRIALQGTRSRTLPKARYFLRGARPTAAPTDND